MTHNLKTWPVSFEEIFQGRKRFEIRVDDRGFSVGDQLVLREWEPTTESYTGRQMRAAVTWKLIGTEWGLQEGYCVMSIRVIGRFAVVVSIMRHA
ncbi:MAG: ASCH/PUA domain-containing protein [Planctomycetota bacterium]|jgi:hypothetical protein